MPIVKKICKFCGKSEEMAESCNTCLSCRIKLFNKNKTKPQNTYYKKNKEKILERAREKRKQGNIKKENKETNKNPWTVHYIKTEGGYIWRAWFRNKKTCKLIKFESAQKFATIKGAMLDYNEATK